MIELYRGGRNKAVSAGVGPERVEHLSGPEDAAYLIWQWCGGDVCQISRDVIARYVMEGVHNKKERLEVDLDADPDVQGNWAVVLFP